MIHLTQILSLSDGERITSIIPVSEFAEDQFLLMLTMQGYIKRVSLNLFSSIRSIGIIAIQLVCSHLNPSVYIASSPLCCLVRLLFDIFSYECCSFILFNLKGSWWWAEMGPSLLKWWLCGHGFSQWNGHAKPMQ